MFNQSDAQAIAQHLCLDSTGTDGTPLDFGTVIQLSGANAVLISTVLFALTATNVSMQVQVSVDGTNFVDKGTAQTQTAIGRKVFTVETGLSAAWVRVKFTPTGAGKAILNAYLSLSQQ